MPLQNQCLVCSRPLPVPRRADARYCGSSCRVRALRARESSRASKGLAEGDSWRLPGSTSRSAVAEVKTQLAIFRELRQARRREDHLAAQLAHAQREAAEQRTRHEGQLRALHRADEVAQQQAASAETKLAAAQAIVEAQTQALAEMTEQLEQERQCSAEQERTARLALAKQAQLEERVSSLDSRLKESTTTLQAERDEAFREAITLGEMLLVAKRSLVEKDAELAKKNEFIEDAAPKLKSLYARLLRIKEKQDWRL